MFVQSLLSMLDKKEIISLVEKAVEGTDAFIVSVTVSSGNDIVVELDSATGIDLDFCAEVTRALNEALDRDVEDYSLEVGSASLTAPFKVRGQYEKHLGDDVELITRDGKKLRGVLTAVGDDDFTVEITRKVKEEGKKRPVMVAQPETFAYDQVKEVKYSLSFK